MKSLVQHINEQINDLKEDFALYIKDKSIPLEERWQVFKEANDALSNHESYFPNLVNYTDEQINDSYDGCDWRGKTFHTVEWVDEYLTETIGDEYTPEDIYDECLNPIKEEILERNMKSWRYDW